MVRPYEFYEAEPIPTCLPPDPAVQEALRLAYGTLLPSIRDVLDPYVHDCAEQAMKEFFPRQRPSDALEDYLADLESSIAIGEMAEELAPVPGTVRDMEKILEGLLAVARKTLKAHRESMGNAGSAYPEALRQSLLAK